MVDEHLNWKDQINVTENKLSKNLGLLHKAKQFLNTKTMKSLIFHSFIAIRPMEMLYYAALP